MNIKSIHKRRPSSIVFTFLAGAVWFLTASTSVFADEFLVNSTSDLVDVAPGDGTCAASGNSGCTLRAAIMETNALTGADTITVPAGTYELTIEGVDETCDPCDIDGTTGDYIPVVSSDASKGDLDITDDVTITGAGSDQTIIKWLQRRPAFRSRVIIVQLPAIAFSM